MTVTDIAAGIVVHADGTITRWIPSARPGYFTGVTVTGGEGTALITIARDGFGDELTFNQVTARRRMTPVRRGNRTVAFIGFSRDADPEISWGLDWTLTRSQPADSYPTEQAACLALAQRYIV